MRVSAKTEYALRALLNMSFRSRSHPVQVKEIAREERIPERFLEQIMSTLKKSALVESVRGARGGYVLAKSPSKITLLDIFQAVEGPLLIADCISQKDTNRCGKKGSCAIEGTWKDLQRVILNELSSITVEDIYKKEKKRKRSGVYIYTI